MLVFFIVTASFLREEGVELERLDGVAKSNEEGKSIPTIFFYITDKDDVWYRKRRIDPRSIRPIVERDKAEMDVPYVVIQADRNATSGRVIQVVESVRLAGVFNYKVATTRGR